MLGNSAGAYAWTATCNLVQQQPFSKSVSGSDLAGGLDSVAGRRPGSSMYESRRQTGFRCSFDHEFAPQHGGRGKVLPFKGIMNTIMVTLNIVPAVLLSGGEIRGQYSTELIRLQQRFSARFSSLQSGAHDRRRSGILNSVALIGSASGPSIPAGYDVDRRATTLT